MIIDLCKPLNEGESDTVRIIMGVDEAHRLLASLSSRGGNGDEFIGGVRRALGHERCPWAGCSKPYACDGRRHVVNRCCNPDNTRRVGAREFCSTCGLEIL